MRNKAWARLENGKIVLGPLIPPENYFSKEKSNSEVSTRSVTNLGWVPVIDNSEEADLTRYAVSADYSIEVFPDRIVKTHKVREFPQEFIEAYNQFVGVTKPSESEYD